MLSGMPYKHHAARRYRIPPARYRVRNWREYEAGLTRRGDLTLWLDEAAMAGWQAPRRTTPGGQAWYSDVAIELVLTLRLVFHLALRQAEGFAASVLRLLGQALRSGPHNLEPAQQPLRWVAAQDSSERPAASGDRQDWPEAVRPGRVG